MPVSFIIKKLKSKAGGSKDYEPERATIIVIY